MIAQAGNKVKVHYKGTLNNGTIFDDSYNREPLEFTIKSGMVIAGFDESVIGMSVGEKKTIHISAEDAYGHRSDDLIIEFKKENIPDELKIEVGDTMQLQLDSQQIVDVLVLEIKENIIVFDANHKLADQDLIFEIELISVE